MRLLVSAGTEPSVKLTPLLTPFHEKKHHACMVQGHISLSLSLSHHFIPPAFSSLLQEMYKASRYEVSPDLKHVLLAYNVAPVSFCMGGLDERLTVGGVMIKPRPVARHCMSLARGEAA